LASAKKNSQHFGFELMPKNDPAIFNQANGIWCFAMCLKVQIARYAFLIVVVLHCKKKVDQLPVKSKKIKVRNRYFNYVVIDANNRTLIQKRTKKAFGTTYMSFL
jgi:A/G-specific adenine glycosylase